MLRATLQSSRVLSWRAVQHLSGWSRSFDCVLSLRACCFGAQRARGLRSSGSRVVFLLTRTTTSRTTAQLSSSRVYKAGETKPKSTYLRSEPVRSHKMAVSNESQISINTARSHSRRSSISSLLLPLTPLSPSPPSAISLLQAGAASPHDVLLYNPELDVSFEIDSVVKILIESPIANSRAPQLWEMRVKIADPDRQTYIRA